jgi:hypothetical protein
MRRASEPEQFSKTKRGGDLITGPERWKGRSLSTNLEKRKQEEKKVREDGTHLAQRDGKEDLCRARKGTQR